MSNFVRRVFISIIIWLKTEKNTNICLEYYDIKAQQYINEIESIDKIPIQYPGDTEEHQNRNEEAQISAFSRTFMLDAYFSLEYN